ncbi:Uncharacterized protein GBIM_03735 [Gryllus bimaculatus]|nr:Uncharacterized protein GBIM_03735 [Gryllus bimaculatus]
MFATCYSTCQSGNSSSSSTPEFRSNSPVMLMDSKAVFLHVVKCSCRFLRRLEQSLKRRERLVSQSDSYGDDDDGCEGSPPVMSPLLPHQSALHEEFKNSSLGHLRHQPHLARARSSSRHRLGSKQKHTGEFLIPYEEQMQWKAVKVAENNGQVE